MVNEETRQCLFQDYMATGLKALVDSYAKVHGSEFTLPSFIEMTHTVKQPQITAKQVIEHLKEVFS